MHLSIDRTPFFDKKAWQALDQRLGGPNLKYESPEKITDIWCLPKATGKNGHGAEFPLALAGRCIALTSRKGDLVLDPFVGAGTTAVAAVMLDRRCLGYDISEKYIDLTAQRLAVAERERQFDFEEHTADAETPTADTAEAQAATLTSKRRQASPANSRTMATKAPRSQSA